MYLQVGNGVYIRKKDIIGIFDLDSATVCVSTRRFLSEMEKKKRVTVADEDLPKSFLLVEERDKGERRKKGRRMFEGRKKKESYVLLSKLTSGVLFSRTAGMATEEETTM